MKQPEEFGDSVLSPGEKLSEDIRLIKSSFGRRIDGEQNSLLKQVLTEIQKRVAALGDVITEENRVAILTMTQHVVAEINAHPENKTEAESPYIQSTLAWLNSLETAAKIGQVAA